MIEIDYGKFSPAELQMKRATLLRLIAAKESALSLIRFSKFMEPDPNAPDDLTKSLYTDQAHHRVVAALLEQAESGALLAQGIRYLCISIGPQKGKLVADDTPILSGRGWIAHGDLRCGDVVFGPDGAPCAVLAVSEPDVASMRVSFTDGSAIDVHPKHEWAVYDKSSHKDRVVETRWMAEQGLWLQKGGIKRTSGRKAESRFSIAPIAPIEMPDVDLPVEPYSLGAWLGDGSVGRPVITHSKRDAIVAETVGAHYPISVSHVHAGTGVHSTSFAKDGWAGRACGLTMALRTAGVLRNKHIPPVYFRASLRQRLELLAGLIDTDGCVHQRTNRWGFANANWRLCVDAARLIATFGWRATFAEYPPKMSSSGIQGKKTVWQVTFSPDIFIPTRIARKNIARPNAVRRARGIASIDPIEPKPGRCIQVSRADGLYCVGNALIATHNSQLCTRNFPAWMAGRNPKKNIMVGSYNDDFAREFGDDVRNIMLKPQYAQVFPRARLRKGGKAKDHMVTEAGGKLNFIGRGGSGTGKPADALLIDDPIKNAEEAASLTIRNTVWQWFLKVADSRTHGNSIIVIVQTRWSEDDLIGRLTDPTNPHYPKKMAAMTKYINIPSIVDDPELAKALGVPVGGSIWEEKFPLWLLKMKQDADPRGFGALEMGRPTPPEGSFYKVDQIRRCWYKDVKELPKGLRKYGSGDLAVSDDLTADWSVVGDWGLDENDILWLMPEIYWMRKKADQTVEHLVTKGKDNWQTFFGEKGQIDRSIRPFLEKRMMEEECFFAVQTFPNVNKGQASLSFRGRMAQGKVRFPVFAEWYQRAEEQMLKFTGSGDDREDDFCDMLARIGQGLQLQVRGSRPQADNVVKLVQPGSIGWAFRQYSNKQEKAKKVSALRGM